MRTFIRLLAVALVATALLPTSAFAQGFASGLAVDGDRVLIGERGGAATTGMVHIYERSGGDWALAASIAPEGAEAGIGFGGAVAVSGDVMLVSSQSGVFVFDRDGDGWSQSAVLTAMTPEGVTFGTGVALQDTRALIAAGGGGFRGPNPAGQVYVFDREANGTWAESATLMPSGSAEGDQFGASLALRGDYAAIGAPGASAGNAQRAGAVYVFHREDDGSWAQVGDPIVAPDATTGSGFGSTVYPHVTEERVTMFVAAGGAAGGAGTVYSFTNNPDGSWTAQNRFFPPVASAGGGRRFGGGGFGTAISVVGDELWIGAGGSGNGGQVLRYTMTDDAWMPAGALSGEGLTSGDGFGGNIAVGEDVAVVAASGKDYRMGTAFIFDRAGDGWDSGTEVWTEPGNYTAVAGGEVSCEEGMASDFACSDIDILSYMPVGQLGAGRGVRTNDVWGWTDPQTGREYALVGMTDQASFVDITDAENPRFVGRLMMTEGARGSTWRDIKVYEDHAFIVSDGAGEHGMQVFDLTRLRDVGSEPVEFDMDAHYDGIASAHNIVINEETGFAYSVGSSGGGETCGGGLHMIDIRNPTEPTFAGCFAHADTGRRGTGYSHDAMCIVYDGPDTEHAGKEICFGSNETTVSIADVSDKDSPVALSQADYPNVGYAHQGWITEDHRYFYLGDELDEIQQAGQGNAFPGTRTMIWDVSDLDDPVFIGEHFGESTASDHNLYIVGDLMYQSNYNSGLRILDVSDPENPTEVGYIDTVPYAEG
ncbi:MAG: choice-of-anchor B family protein, partial [Gemmatimonadota bacterium]|nr:choice-of-anchor B family protein [Gemmatimonadota bacterium]